MITIGVTAVGSGIGQSILRSLSFSDLDYRVVGMDINPHNSGIHWVDRAFLIPRVGDAEYRDRVLSIVATEKVNLLVPGLDVELMILTELSDALAELGCTVLVSNPEVITLSVDKLATWEWCDAHGLSFAPTWTLDDAQSHADELQYPLIVKPRFGSASTGVRLALDPAGLLAEPATAQRVVQPYLVPRGFDLEPTIPPNDPGQLDQSNEVSAQYMIGPSGDILGNFVSMNRLKDGIPVQIEPAMDASWTDDGIPLVHALAAKGARGPINLQGRLTSDGHLRFFELNARFTGITGIRAMMGYREVEAAVRAFAQSDEPAARSCLRFDDKFIGLRHVGDMIVPADRVRTLTRDRTLPVPLGIAEAGARGVLVTGAAGYVGSNTLVRLLADDSAGDVHAVVRSAHARHMLEELFPDEHRLSVIVHDVLTQGFELPDVDTVIHLAAARSAGAAGDRSIYETNVEGTRMLLAAARSAGASRFVYVSSQAVYGTSRPPLWGEALPVQPETAYGTAKWLGEMVCGQAIAGDTQVAILRAARVYGHGPMMRWSELPHLLAELTAQRESPQLHGDGSHRMDFVHVRDLADAILAAARVELPGGYRTVINIGGGHPTSLRELASLTVDAALEFGLPAPALQHVERTGSPPRDFGMDIRRSRALLGWSPGVSLADGVRELVEAALARTLVD